MKGQMMEEDMIDATTEEDVIDKICGSIAAVERLCDIAMECEFQYCESSWPITDARALIEAMYALSEITNERAKNETSK